MNKQTKSQINYYSQYVKIEFYKEAKTMNNKDIALFL